MASLLRVFHRQFLLILFAGIGLGAFFVSFLVAGEIYDYADTVDGVKMPNVDAIVCLAGGRGRIAAAGDIWNHYHELAARNESGITAIPTLFISGAGQKANFSVVASQFREGVRKMIRPTDVMVENKSENTVENAFEFIQIAKERNWHHILVITSPYHMRRSVYLFQKMSAADRYELKIETLTFYQEPFEPGEWKSSLIGIRVTLLEYAKWIFYRFFWTT